MSHWGRRYRSPLNATLRATAAHPASPPSDRTPLHAVSWREAHRGCTGKTTATAVLVPGSYTCKGITSYVAGSGKMGKVNLAVTFTARSGD